jgi:RNA-directed DNA polymerase
MICSRLDSQLQELAKTHRCRYTRYADDLTFSTHLSNFPKEIGCYSHDGQALTGDALEEVIRSNGFLVNPEKVRLQRWDSHQEVTGLTVNRKPNVSRRFVRQIRAMLHAWHVHGLAAAEQEHLTRHRLIKHRDPAAGPPSYQRVVHGKISFHSMVRGADDHLVRNFRAQYNRLAAKAVAYDVPPDTSSSADPRKTNLMISGIRRSAMWVIECDEQDSQGTGFLLNDYGFITCAHVLCEHAHQGKMKAWRPRNNP